MSAILKFDFQKKKQLCFSELNYLNYTKKTQYCMWQNKNKLWSHVTRALNLILYFPFKHLYMLKMILDN